MDFSGLQQIQKFYGNISLSELIQLAQQMKARHDQNADCATPSTSQLSPSRHRLVEPGQDVQLGANPQQQRNTEYVTPAIPQLSPSRYRVVEPGLDVQLGVNPQQQRNPEYVTLTIPQLSPSRYRLVEPGPDVRLGTNPEASGQRPGNHQSDPEDWPVVILPSDDNITVKVTSGAATSDSRAAASNSGTSSRSSVAESSSGTEVPASAAASTSTSPPSGSLNGQRDTRLDKDCDEIVVDTKLYEFLKARELDGYLGELSKQGIDNFDDFSLLTESDVDVFCSVLGDRVKFRKILRTMQRPVQVEEDGDFFSKPGSFKSWLKSQALGHDILDHHQAGKELTNQQRNTIVAMVLSAAKRRGTKFGDAVYKSMAAKIAETFGEQEEMYYKPSVTEFGLRSAPSGKLVKRKCLNPQQKKSKKARGNDLEDDTPIANREEQIAARSWLQKNRSPSDMVVNFWTTSYELRLQDIKAADGLVDVLEAYPIIKQPCGGKLISSDFDRMYPEASNNFFLRFQNLHGVLEPIIKKALKGEKHVERFALYEKASGDNDLRDLLLAWFLPLVIPTDYKVRGTNWKPSIADAQKFFIIEVTTAGEVGTKTDECIQLLAKLSKSAALQPHVVTVGPLEKAAYLVVFGGAQYACESIKQALLLCIQICYVLHLEYSCETLPAWCFLQEFLCRIPSVGTIPKSCEKMLKVALSAEK